MILRRAEARDVPSVAALEDELFDADAWSLDSVRSELTGPRRAAVVACDPDLVGYVVARLGDDVVDLHRVAVVASHRRRGLASRLLAEVPSGGSMLLEVSVRNETALAFYAAEGFTEITRRLRYYRDGSDAVVMGRPARA